MKIKNLILALCLSLLMTIATPFSANADCTSEYTFTHDSDTHSVEFCMLVICTPPDHPSISMNCWTTELPVIP
jgi:hypothetical protein